MRYFRRVTTRVPGDAGGESATAGSHEIKGPGGNKAMNAVVMGRRTWESIPLRFRPLRGEGQCGCDVQGFGTVCFRWG